MDAMNLPVLALRGLTAFPNMHISFDVERPAFIASLEHAREADQMVFLVAQKEIITQEPREADLYTVGTISHVRQSLRLSPQFVRVMTEGQTRARLKRLWQTEPYYQALVEPIPHTEESNPANPRVEALLRLAYTRFSDYAAAEGNLPEELVAAVIDCCQPGYLADFIAQNIPLRHTDKQIILEERRPSQRLRKLITMLTRETDVLQFEHEMEEKIRHHLEQAQKEQILRTEIHVLQNELGEVSDEDGDDEVEDDDLASYRRRILELHLPEESETHLLRELRRLARQPYASAESSVIRDYLDTCLEVPWKHSTQERLNTGIARKILEKNHYGLKKVKERILEAIAVRQMTPMGKGQILCLVGPPGVGKTSIAISIARALNRKLARISLGGVRDEADIRGHRKTYIGAMPGRIADAVIRSGSMNPLLLLDEVDKIGNDFRGDPAAALLEALDAEQNYSFRDHYLEIPLDLSRTMFITTANSTETIPRPLLDRMEIIHLDSYTDEEKLEIAKRHLFPKQLEAHGLKKTQLRVSDDALREIIRNYTREAGVRNLERQIGKLCRKTDVLLLDGENKRISITPANLQEFLGPARYPPVPHADQEEVGVVNGLAWTELGGEILEVEVNVMEGSGKLSLTGNLGDVMKESVQAAHSCLRSRAAALGIDPSFHKEKDIHVHFPEGAVPKDGPSAGIAIATAMLSALTGRKIRAGLAMTGEITIRGRVLPIGGLKEKSMAAKRHHIHTVLIPRENRKDLEELDPAVRDALEFIPVTTVDDVFEQALCPTGTLPLQSPKGTAASGGPPRPGREQSLTERL